MSFLSPNQWQQSTEGNSEKELAPAMENVEWLHHLSIRHCLLRNTTLYVCHLMLIPLMLLCCRLLLVHLHILYGGAVLFCSLSSVVIC